MVDVGDPHNGGGGIESDGDSVDDVQWSFLVLLGRSVFLFHVLVQVVECQVVAL